MYLYYFKHADFSVLLFIILLFVGVLLYCKFYLFSYVLYTEIARHNEIITGKGFM